MKQYKKSLFEKFAVTQKLPPKIICMDDFKASRAIFKRSEFVDLIDYKNL